LQYKDDIGRTIALSLLGSIPLMPLLVLPVMVGSFVDHLGFSDSQAGYAASAGFLGGALSAIYVSFRIHRLNLRRLSLLGLCLMALVDGVSMAAAQIPAGLFVILRFISGAAGVCVYSSVMASFAGWREPSRAYGLFMSFQFMASAMGLFGLPWVLPQTGVAAVFGLFTALSLLGFFLVRQLPPPAERRGVGPDAPLEWRVILSVTALACLLAIGLFEAANMAHFTYAERIGITFGLGARDIGLVLGIATMTGIPGSFGVLLLGSRFGRFAPITAAVLIQIAALQLLLNGSGAASYLVAMCLLASLWGFALPYFQAIEARLDQGGSVVVAGGFATSFGGFLGPAVAASLVSPGRYGGMMLAITGSYFIVIALIQWVRLRMERPGA
jgi:MFS family permease